MNNNRNFLTEVFLSEKNNQGCEVVGVIFRLQLSKVFGVHYI